MAAANEQTYRGTGLAVFASLLSLSSSEIRFHVVPSRNQTVR
jgi:hypothetical protein